MIKVGIITLSDKGYSGEREDLSGALIEKLVSKAGMQVVLRKLLPDDRSMLEQELILASEQVNLLLTTGGTGFSKRDITPEATLAVIQRRCDGVVQSMIANGLTYTPRAMLTRAACGIRGNCVILNLPGSPKAVQENLEYVLPSIEHGINVLLGEGECAR